MKCFQKLLDPTTFADPGEQQAEASRQLPNLVAKSHLRWWKAPHHEPPPGRALLVIVAPYSQYDLAMLDILDDVVAGQGSGDPSIVEEIYVANIESYESLDDLRIDIPALKSIPLQTPLVASWADGKIRELAFGKLGRDLVARELGIYPSGFNEFVLQRVHHATHCGI